MSCEILTEGALAADGAGLRALSPYPATTTGAPPNDGDFYWEEIVKAAPPAYIAKTAGQPLQPSGLLGWLWGKAVAEWQQ